MIEFAARDVAPEWAALAAQAATDATTNLAFPGAADINHDPLAGLLTRTLLNNIGSPYDPRGLGRNHTKDYEIEVVNLLGDVFSAPPTRWGYVTSGSTEAIRHALLDGRRRYPQGVVYVSAAGHPVDRTRRLIEIIRSLGERISEATANGWPGEVQGLNISLTAAQTTLIALDRTANRSTTIPLALPTLTGGKS